jgi:hypothetical protein
MSIDDLATAIDDLVAIHGIDKVAGVIRERMAFSESTLMAARNEARMAAINAAIDDLEKHFFKRMPHAIRDEIHAMAIEIATFLVTNYTGFCFDTTTMGAVAVHQSVLRHYPPAMKIPRKKRLSAGTICEYLKEKTGKSYYLPIYRCELWFHKHEP